MAKLERKTQKILAGNANAGDISAFGTMKTGNPIHTTDMDILQNEDYLKGWDTAIKEDKAPYLEEMNAVQYGITRQMAYLYQQGIAEWDANTTYYIGSYVTYNGKIYISKTDDNLGHAIAETTYWEEYGKDFMKTDFSNATSQPWITMLNALFPVGALYLGTMTNCPLAALIPGSQWQKVAQDRCLQGAGTTWGANVNVAQGLPNITGSFYDATALSGQVSGAFYGTGTGVSSQPLYASGVSTMNFNASRSNSTYSQPQGRVQPYAYTTNIWRRIA